MSENRCCCNCRHDIRTWDKGNCECHCDIDGHYIGYVECFEHLIDGMNEEGGDAE